MSFGESPIESKLSIEMEPNKEKTEVSQSQPVASQLQIINEHQEFSDKLKHYMKDVWHLTQEGFNYNMVAVFGSQSTGKSTLLNALFETNFDTMGDSYRQQTTKGLWAATAKNSNILVLDVEGVDGRERGEDQDFERKSALFSLAVSQVLLVNIWESQVGLYNGANMGLLKTVFEVNLELFQKTTQNKTLLFFVIRDHIGKIPLERLAETIKQDLDKAWMDLTKPTGMEKCSITDYFDFSFFGLPHKILLPEEFDKQVDQMGKMFYNPDHPHYVFKPKYHKQIPADGFSTYASNIWEQIVANKDLDLPTQQQLMAQFRCEEISSGLFKQIQTEFVPVRESIERGELVEDLGKKFHSLKNDAISEFDIGAGRYNKEVYQKKRGELVSKIEDYLQTYFKEQLSTMLRFCFDQFSSSIEAGLKEVDYNFMSMSKKAAAAALDKFTNAAESLVLEGSSWSFNKEKHDLEHDIEEYINEKSKHELTKREAALARNIAEHFDDIVPSILSGVDSNLWKELLSEFHQVVTTNSERMREQAKAFGLEETDVCQRVADVRAIGWKALVRRVKDEVSDTPLLAKLKRRLEDVFRYDSDGLPRVWSPSDDIDGCFREAKNQAMELIPLLCRIQIDESPFDFDTYFEGCSESYDFRKSLLVLNATKRSDAERKFKKEADALFLEAKRSVVATTAKVPYWVLVLLFVLGWNEILYILTNPLTLLLTVIGGGGFYALYVMKLLGPISLVVKVVSRELMVLVKKALDEAELSNRAQNTLQLKSGRANEESKYRSKPSSSKNYKPARSSDSEEEISSSEAATAVDSSSIDISPKAPVRKTPRSNSGVSKISTDSAQTLT